MRIERGIRRLVIVLSGLILVLGTIMGLAQGDIGLGVALAGVAIALLWVAFFTVRWVARGFLPDTDASAPHRRRIPWKTVKDWIVIGVVSVTLLYIAGLLLWGLWAGVWAFWEALRSGAILRALGEVIRHPAATWQAIVSWFLAIPHVIWLRQTVGDRTAAMIGLVFAALFALGAAEGLRGEFVARRQRRAYRRLSEHYAGCPACRGTADSDEFVHDGRDYCPVGQRLYSTWSRT